MKKAIIFLILICLQFAIFASCASPETGRPIQIVSLCFMRGSQSIEQISKVINTEGQKDQVHQLERLQRNMKSKLYVIIGCAAVII